MKYLIQIHGSANGSPCPFAGEYLSFYDVAAHDGRGYIETTPDKQKAMHFDSAAAVHECWSRSHGVRPDGKPNRPLTAFHVVITTLEKP